MKFQATTIASILLTHPMPNIEKTPSSQIKYSLSISINSLPKLNNLQSKNGLIARQLQ
jgi:hypothetical protein